MNEKKNKFYMKSVDLKIKNFQMLAQRERLSVAFKQRSICARSQIVKQRIPDTGWSITKTPISPLLVTIRRDIK